MIVRRTPRQALLHWIAALESGRYRQTQGQLRKKMVYSGGSSRHTYCCLGVLCDLASKDGGPEWKTKYNRDNDEELYDGDDGVLPHAIAKYIGLTEDELDELVDMNDQQEANFKQIAAYIRKNILPRIKK